MNIQNTSVPDALKAFISDGTLEEIAVRYAQFPALAQSSDYGRLDRNIVVLDTETTGFSFNHDELTQIAAARMEKGKIVDWFVTFVNPGKPIPEEVAHLTDIHDEDVADAPLPNEALAQLASFVGDAYVIAHNAEFDRTFTTNHPGGYPLLENVWIDTLDLARIAVPRLKSHRLLDIVRAYEAPLSTHRADADVEATCVAYRILLAAIQSMPYPLVSLISEMAPKEEWPTQVVFQHMAELMASGKIVSRETIDEKLSFSLKNLRRNRLGTQEYRSNIDAEDIAKDPDRSLVFPTTTDIEEAFSSQGLVGELYQDFEPRKEQLQMSEAVLEAFASSENLLVEAGTGVGKSMAYLVPSALVAKKNSCTVGVATKTNALLDQLVYHELPALAQALASCEQTEEADNGGQAPQTPLTFAPLKGFSHYPCLRRVESRVREGASLKIVAGKERSQAPALAALLSFVEQTDYDDIDGLKIDYRTLPRWSITTTSHDCLRRKCPFFGTSCFVHGSRRRAEAADVIVTNHSLLFCDLAADGGLLPPVRYWVVDEAHNAEEEARRAFSLSLSAEDIVRLTARVGADDSSRNLFVRAERKAVAKVSEEGSTLLYALTAKAKAAGRTYSEAAQLFVSHMKDLLFFDANKRGRSYETTDIWLNHEIRQSATFGVVAEHGASMANAAEKLVTACQELVAYLEEFDGVAEVQREIAGVAMELKDQLRAVNLILLHPEENYAYSATLNRKSDKLTDTYEALLLNVGAMLNETLFERTHSAVFASATLTVNGSFSSFENALGLNATEYSKTRMCQLSSSYDFDGNMTVYVVEDMPEPNDMRYLGQLQQLLTAAHLAQGGSMLTLFTNRKEMEACFDAVNPALHEQDLRLVCQKWGVSVKGLRDDFLADEHLSLFALKSFWEGFDAPGATLKGVIIPKLPFSKPTDPLSCERAARDDQAWRKFVLPKAVLETKQAAGRLIRKADDSGVVILADHRLISKGYGKAFLNSMPSKTIKILPAAQIIERLQNGAHSL